MTSFPTLRQNAEDPVAPQATDATQPVIPATDDGRASHTAGSPPPPSDWRPGRAFPGDQEPDALARYRAERATGQTARVDWLAVIGWLVLILATWCVFIAVMLLLATVGP